MKEPSLRPATSSPTPDKRPSTLIDSAVPTRQRFTFTDTPRAERVDYPDGREYENTGKMLKIWSMVRDPVASRDLGMAPRRPQGL